MTKSLFKIFTSTIILFSICACHSTNINNQLPSNLTLNTIASFEKRYTEKDEIIINGNKIDFSELEYDGVKSIWVLSDYTFFTLLSSQLIPYTDNYNVTNIESKLHINVIQK